MDISTADETSDLGPQVQDIGNFRERRSYLGIGKISITN